MTLEPLSQIHRWMDAPVRLFTTPVHAAATPIALLLYGYGFWYHHRYLLRWPLIIFFGAQEAFWSLHPSNFFGLPFVLIGNRYSIKFQASKREGDKKENQSKTITSF